ncbi:hypothetical protein MSAN_01909800 [Mycena sanguinolenta]|uniref:Uncharacterized protein n=1 Tax=Mycena sanguinolenta TaxID=230812 RepID=A0A8H6XRC7_9AGAR|nr:hypothetical protein MSAN_01909800 [Mycena sanguinolenta]
MPCIHISKLRRLQDYHCAHSIMAIGKMEFSLEHVIFARKGAHLVDWPRDGGDLLAPSLPFSVLFLPLASSIFRPPISPFRVESLARYPTFSGLRFSCSLACSSSSWVAHCHLMGDSSPSIHKRIQEGDCQERTQTNTHLKHVESSYMLEGVVKGRKQVLRPGSGTTNGDEERGRLSRACPHERVPARAPLFLRPPGSLFALTPLPFPRVSPCDLEILRVQVPRHESPLASSLRPFRDHRCACRTSAVPLAHPARCLCAPSVALVAPVGRLRSL